MGLGHRLFWKSALFILQRSTCDANQCVLTPVSQWAIGTERTALCEGGCVGVGECGGCYCYKEHHSSCDSFSDMTLVQQIIKMLVSLGFENRSRDFFGVWFRIILPESSLSPLRCDPRNWAVLRKTNEIRFWGSKEEHLLLVRNLEHSSSFP